MGLREKSRYEYCLESPFFHPLQYSSYNKFKESIIEKFNKDSHEKWLSKCDCAIIFDIRNFIII